MGLMGDCAHADSMVPPIEERTKRLWDPILVSRDTEGAGIDVAGEDGAVDQSANTFWTPMSGNFELDP